MKKITLCFLIMIISAARFCYSQTEEVLTNEKVIELFQKGLSSSILVNKIQVTKNTFDVSTDALLKLKEQKIPDEVVNAMIIATGKNPTGTKATEPSEGQGIKEQEKIVTGGLPGQKFDYTSGEGPPGVSNGFGINMTRPGEDLGIGLSYESYVITKNHLVIGFAVKDYYKHFQNTSYKVKVSNISLVFPLTFGYQISLDEFLITPYAGLMGGLAFQLVTNYETFEFNSNVIGDGGYIIGSNFGYGIGRLTVYLGAAFENNLDSNGSDGHFFKSVPITIGLLWNKNVYKY